MRTWAYSANPHPEWRIAVLDLIDQPWWLAWCEWMEWRVVALLCHVRLSLPSARLQREWGTVGSWWCGYVHNPVARWVYRKQRPYRYQVSVGYDALRDALYMDNPEFFDEMEERHRAHEERTGE